MDDVSKVGEARRFALILCGDFDFDETRTGKVSIVITELGNNLVRYANNPQLILRGFSNGRGRGIEVLSIDSGPGLVPSLAIEDGYSTGSTPGTGLGSAKRQSDIFDIYSTKESGTVIVSRVFARDTKHKCKIEVGTVSVPIKGELLCGDAWAVCESEFGFRAIVTDGLGHGPLANHASLEAIDSFSSNLKANINDLITLVHENLRRSRGAAVFALNNYDNNIEFAGVGNVRAVVVGAHESKTLISQNGTAGVKIGTVRSLTEKWDGYGYLVLHSDGLNSRWDLNSYPEIFGKHPSIIAAVLYRDANRNTDDSTVVVIRKVQ